MLHNVWEASAAGDSVDLGVEVAFAQAWFVSACNWLNVSSISGMGRSDITINAAANDTGSARTGYVTIRGGGIERVITVNQAAD